MVARGLLPLQFTTIVWHRLLMHSSMDIMLQFLRTVRYNFKCCWLSCILDDYEMFVWETCALLSISYYCCLVFFNPFSFCKTGSGKTYSMGTNYNGEVSGGGIIPRVLDTIFDRVNATRDSTEFLIRVSFIEVNKMLYCWLVKMNFSDIVN